MYICLCHGITDKQIRACVVETGARTLCDLSGQLGVATQCGGCADSACELLVETLTSTATHVTLSLESIKPSSVAA